MNISDTFSHLFDRRAAVHVVAPGRVNLLGEHVDYNDGIVLPAAIDRAVTLAAAPLDEAIVHLQALDLNAETRFSLDALAARRDLDDAPLPDWALYPAGVAWALREAGLAVCGLQAAFTSDVPMGAGLSSSAAVELAFAVAWQALGDWQAPPLRLAQLAQRAENAYVGVACGLMDQFASACGVEGHALAFDTRHLTWEAVPLPPDTALLIADSGVRRSLAHSAYNQRRAACEQAAALLGVPALRDVSPADFEAHLHRLPDNIRPFARHVVEEIARVQQALEVLRAGDAPAFGRLMLAGHASLRDLYRVSTPELDALVEIAADLPGCYGARLTGAGFGGCTVNLVDESLAPQVADALQGGYRTRMGRQSQVYICRAAQGAHVLP